MLAIDKVEKIEGLAVYGDHAAPHVFYILPNTPRFRLDERKRPVFKFLKYKFPVDRADGKKGGGFVIFDVEFVVPEEIMPKVKSQLQERLNQRFKDLNPKPQVQIGTLTFLKGSAQVQVLDSGGVLVQKVQNPGQPSLYGNYITPITVELSPEGATLAEQALQGKGGVVQVAYNLTTIVRLPPLKVFVDFWASKFMEFHQQVKIGTNMWGSERSRSERVSEMFNSSEYARVHVEPGMVTDQKVINQVRDWGFGVLEDAVKRMVLKDIDPVKDDQRKVNEGLERLTRDIIVSRTVDFHRRFTEGQAMEWDPAPRGTLPNITNIEGVKWSDYAAVVDLDDPFFKQLNLAVNVNADFQRLPIHSIDVHIDYPKAGGKKEVKDFSFKGPNDVGKFATFIENNNWKYKYSYQVHYKGASQTFKSPTVESEQTHLTIDAGDTGILTVDLMPGDLDFDQIKSALITIRYEGSGVPPVEQQFLMDKDRREHRFQKVLSQPIQNPYKYKVKYIMKDGKEFQADWIAERSPTLMINDVWNAMKTVAVRGRGNFETDVDEIHLELIYLDAPNKYTQAKSVALTKDQKFFDWTFPVINEIGGKVTYSGTIKYKNNSEEEIPNTEATSNIILVGPKVTGFIEVQVLPDLIDFEKVKLAKISLSYEDSANGINAKKDIVFKAGATEPVTWKVELKDKKKTAYQWQATFFMVDGSTSTTGPLTAEEPTLIPQLTLAKAANV